MNNKKINPILVLILILQIQTCLMVAKGYEKEFFHLDETFTFTLANNKNGINISDSYKNTWRSGIDYYRLLTVSPEDRFNYRQVYINQTEDVHPPLYYFVIHTISSFFPYEFSKWFGIIPNIVFFLCTQIFVFLTANIILESKIKSLLPCILYGFSLGAVSSVEFIRMYIMTTAFLMASIYINCRIIQKNYLHSKELALLFFINLAGYLTHYYYIIYSFFTCLFMVIYIYSKLSLKNAFTYSLTNIFSILILPLCYPESLSHIFSGSRGVEAFQNLTVAPFLERLYLFIQIVNKHLFDKNLLYIITLIAICLLTKLFPLGRQVKKTTTLSQHKIFASKKSVYYIFLLCFISILSFLLLVKIAAYIEFRYISPLYPIFMIIISTILITLCNINTITKGVFIYLCTSIIYSGVAFNYTSKYENYNNSLSLISEEDNVFIINLPSYNLSFSNFLPMMNKHKKGYIVTSNKLSDLFTTIEKKLEDRKTSAGMYIISDPSTKYKIDEIVNNFKKYQTERRDIELISCIKIICMPKKER